MKKKYRAFSLVLAVILMFSMFTITAKTVGTNPTITVSTAIGKAGEDVTVDVRISDNPGIAGYKLTIDYDPAILDYTGGSTDSVSPDDQDPLDEDYQIKVAEDIQNGGMLLVNQVTQKSYSDKPLNKVIVVAFVAQDNVTSASGLLFTLPFKIKAAGVAEGSYPLTIAAGGDDVSDIANVNGNEIKFYRVDGKVNVVEKDTNAVLNDLKGLENETAADILTNIREIKVNSLASAIEDDAEILTALAKLEATVESQFGGLTVDGLTKTELGFAPADDVPEIEVVGAMLNSESGGRIVKTLDISPATTLPPTSAMTLPLTETAGVIMNSSMPHVMSPVTVRLPADSLLYRLTAPSTEPVMLIFESQPSMRPVISPSNVKSA